MRTLLKVTIPVEAGNAAIKDGSLPRIIGEFLERQKPEAAYFLTDRIGRRMMLAVVDMKDPSDIPSLAEPFFMGFNAAVEATPVMTAEDLKKGLAKIS